MRYRVEETADAFRLEALRRPALRRARQILGAMVAWTMLAYVAGAYIVPPSHPGVVLALFLVPLLAGPALEKAVSAAIWPERLFFARDAGSITVGRGTYERSRVRGLRFRSGQRQRRVLWVRIAVNGVHEMDFALAAFDEAGEAGTVADRLSAFLGLPLAQQA
jgi:hypothetical protein